MGNPLVNTLQVPLVLLPCQSHQIMSWTLLITFWLKNLLVDTLGTELVLTVTYTVQIPCTTFYC